MARARFWFQVAYDFLYTRCNCVLKLKGIRVWFLDISVKSCFIADINWISQTRSDLCKIFIKYVGIFILCYLLTLVGKKRGYSDFILFRQIIPLKVSHVFLMSLLYLVNLLIWYSFLAACIHWFRYPWYNFKLCLYTSYSTGHNRTQFKPFIYLEIRWTLVSPSLSHSIVYIDTYYI